MWKTATSGWPLVREYQQKQRRNGSYSGKCAFCKRAVGSPHCHDCISVSKRVEYVITEVSTGETIGTCVIHDPHCWTDEESEFHKNDSTWCASNVGEEITTTNPDAFLRTYGNPKRDCPCYLVRFKVSRVVDEGPFEYIDQE